MPLFTITENSVKYVYLRENRSEIMSFLKDLTLIKAVEGGAGEN